MPRPEKQRPALNAFYSGVFFSSFDEHDLEAFKISRHDHAVEHVDSNIMNCFQTPARSFQDLFIRFAEMRLFNADVHALVDELISVAEKLEKCDQITMFEKIHFIEVREHSHKFLRTALMR